MWLSTSSSESHFQILLVSMKSGKNKVDSETKRQKNCRLNQVRHRVKQKDKLEFLSTSIDELKLNVQRLEYSTMDFDKIVQQVKVQAAQSRLCVIEDLYQLFEFGMNDVPTQLAFVQSNMMQQVSLSGRVQARETFWNQMRMLSTLYSKVQFEICKIDVCGLTHEILHVTCKLHLQLNRTVIQMLYPNLNKEYDMVEFLIGKWLSVDIHLSVLFRWTFH